MPINKRNNIEPFACRVTRNGTRNKSIASNLARKGLNNMGRVLPILSILAFVVIPLAIATGTSASTTLNFAIDANPSMTITLQDANSNNLTDNKSTLSISPTNEGTFGSQNINVLVGTNNYSGYTLYITSLNPALSNSSILPNNEIYTIDPISNNSGNGYTLQQFQSSSDTLNKWGYSVQSTNIENFSTNFFPVTTSSVEINNNSSVTETPDTTTITFATKLNNAVPSGEYDTSIVFIATANPNPSCYDSGCTITYNSNGVTANGTTAPTMSTQTVAANTSSVMLWPSNFKNPTGANGKGFAGWNTKADGTGINYGPMETIDTNTIFSGNVTLYANWIASAGNMQDWNGCSNLSIGQVTALTDTRDNNVYAVARLTDGKCWMIENMRITNSATLSNANTNVPQIANLAASSDSWSISNINISQLNTQNTVVTGQLTDPTNQYVYSYGDYYNWYSGTSANKNNNVSVSGDICPNNWRLPIGGGIPNATSSAWGDNSTNSDFYKLGTSILGVNMVNDIDQNLSNNSNNYSYYAGKSNLFRAYPYNFILSGYWFNSLVGSRGTGGNYWSSTAIDAAGSYYMGMTNSYILPGTNYYNRVGGMSVRCLIGN